MNNPYKKWSSGCMIEFMLRNINLYFQCLIEFILGKIIDILFVISPRYIYYKVYTYYWSNSYSSSYDYILFHITLY